MLTFSDSSIRAKISDELHERADHIAFLPFNDLKQSVIDDIEFVRKNSLLLDIPVTGYIYEVETGKIVQVKP